MVNLFGIILLCAIPAYAADNWTLTGLDEAIQVKCVKNTNNIESAHQFTNALEEYSDCQSKLILNHNESQYTVKELCKLMNQNGYRDCLANYTRNFSVCLDETEAYLPKLILRAAESRLKYLCSIDGLTDAKYFKNIANYDDCFLLNYYVTISVFNNGSIAAKGECLSNLRTFKNLDKEILNLDKNDVYNDLLQLKKCWSKVLKRNCMKDYSRYVELHLDPYITQYEILLHNSSLGHFSNLLTMLMVSISFRLISLVKIF